MFPHYRTVEDVMALVPEGLKLGVWEDLDPVTLDPDTGESLRWILAGPEPFDSVERIVGHVYETTRREFAELMMGRRLEDKPSTPRPVRPQPVIPYAAPADARPLPIALPVPLSLATGFVLAIDAIGVLLVGHLIVTGVERWSA